MNLRHLQFFVILTDELNFSRAAERLHVAQPALSRQISLLEQRLGAQLFDRSGRPLRLTEAGHYFSAEARQLLASYERATLATREIGCGKRSWLGIGFTRSAMYSVLPTALKAFDRTHPDVELKLFEMLTEEQADALHEHRIHVGIGRQAQTAAGCSSLLLLRERVMIALSHDHPLAGNKAVRIAQLAQSPLVLYPKHPNARFSRFIESLYRDAGVTPRVAHHAYEIQTAIALAGGGLGVTFVGESVARHRRPDVVYRPLQGVGASRTTTLTASFRNDDLTPHLHAFLKTLAPHDSIPGAPAPNSIRKKT
ncbi:LysR family transcriptional regulator [Paraburkholderia madseniana]|uniref:LysR family transcriptional regulator n=1 Tax=Paraburkholderia madseniana TaxID=2599607 RepID=A0A6N6WFE3_9BURK|nr:LysR family transcriptional regulator [Paraburkholderia madseniana]KAE8758504.1 LysR family transcriptional regulator [Paraburkholderia madseniana]